MVEVFLTSKKTILYLHLVAPVVQLVTSKPSDTLGREFKSR